VIVPPVHPIAVRIAFSVPQILVLFAEIVGAVGTIPVSILIIFDAKLVPHEFLHFAVYVPTPTNITFPVDPLLHSTVELQPTATNLAFAVSQTVTLSVVINGAFGTPPIVILTILLFGLSPHEFWQTAA
jgi:hypothetical protein